MSAELIDEKSEVPVALLASEQNLRRLLVAILLSIPLCILAWTNGNAYLQLLLCLPLLFWCGVPLLHGGLSHFSKFSALAAAAVLSFTLRSISILIPSQHEAGLFLFVVFPVLFVLVWESISDLLSRKREAVAVSLLELIPKRAMLFIDNDIQTEINSDNIQPENLICVKAGERLPADGVITYGSSYLEESPLRKNAKPLAKGPGSFVFAGSLNKSSVLVFRVTKVGRDSFLGHIAEQVRMRRPKYKSTGLGMLPQYTLLLALLSFLAWLYILGPGEWMSASMRALSVLLATSLFGIEAGLKLPTRIALSISAARGILFRNEDAIRSLADADALVFGKSGFLTEEKPFLSSVLACSGFSEEQIFSAVAALERYSSHPIAGPILQEARLRNMPLLEAQEVREHTLGMSGFVESQETFVGAKAFFPGKMELSRECRQLGETLLEKNESPLYVTIGEKCAGVIGLKNTIREKDVNALGALKKLGLHPVLATSEEKPLAKYVAEKFSIDHISAGSSPEEKLRLLKKLCAEDFHPVVVGLEFPEERFPEFVRVSTGTYTEEKSDVALLYGELPLQYEGSLLAHETRNIEKQNFFALHAYHLIALPFAAGVFNPHALSPSWAFVGSLMCFALTSLNSLRLSLNDPV